MVLSLLFLLQKNSILGSLDDAENVKCLLFYRPLYYLGNIYRRLFNPSYLGCFSVDFNKQGAFRKLLSISFHMPPSALFYLFSFRNGKRSRKTIRIRRQEEMESLSSAKVYVHLLTPINQLSKVII